MVLTKHRHTSFYWASQMFHFSHIEGKIHYQQQNYNSLYCNIHLIAVVWN